VNVARPPGGFRIVVRPEVAKYIEAGTQDYFRVRQFWLDILDRLKITGLREGTPISGRSVPSFLFIADGARDFRIPTVQVSYSCLGDTLTIQAALVWQDGDSEAEREDG